MEQREDRAECRIFRPRIFQLCFDAGTIVYLRDAEIYSLYSIETYAGGIIYFQP